MATKTYRINEIFPSLQGEGLRAGTPNVFVRFAGCDLACKKATHGFDCDTEFVSGRTLSLDQILFEIHDSHKGCGSIVFTGGEPCLQVDNALIKALHQEGFHLAIETNGAHLVPEGIDWITVSPKVAEHCIQQRVADEVKYVRGYGQAIPKTSVRADHYLISPAFDGDILEPKTLRWCSELCFRNAPWRLSLQLHKFLCIR